MSVPRAAEVRWKPVDSSNVEEVGWDRHQGMYVTFKSGATYLYHGVTRQRAVACAMAPSVGSYINKVIKPEYECTRLP
jgi:hypothetical protein